MRRSSDSPLLPVGASAAEERRLRQILTALLAGESVTSVQAQIKNQISPEYHSRAEFLTEEVLKDNERYGKVTWLSGEQITQPPQSQSGPRLDGVPKSGRRLFEASLELPPEELHQLGRAILEAAQSQEDLKPTEQLIVRAEALTAITEDSDAVAELTRKIEYNVVRAKENGATWAEIGTAAGVKGDVAFKRWSPIVKGRSDPSDD